MISGARAYLSAIVLAIGALLFFYYGRSDVRESAAAAGFALLGAALVRWLDVWNEQASKREMSIAEQRKALDETRRVAYMALLAGTSGRHELVGTLVNALVHHAKVTSYEEAAANVPTVVNGADESSEPGTWLRHKIHLMTERLERLRSTG